VSRDEFAREGIRASSSERPGMAEASGQRLWTRVLWVEGRNDSRMTRNLVGKEGRARVKTKVSSDSFSRFTSGLERQGHASVGSHRLHLDSLMMRFT